MKKALALSLILLVVAIPVFAEGWDFTAMSTDELIELKNLVIAEIKARVGTFDSSHISAGTYVVGEDIDPGSYIFFFADEYDDNVYLSVFKNEEDKEAQKRSAMIRIGNKDEENRIVLADGNYLVIDGSNGVDIRKAEKIIVP